jgi:hypothetical protein
MPISSVTPGATNPRVTQSNIKTTICKSGWTKTIRPNSSYTNKIKKEELFGTYALYSNKSMGNYEEDHLISLELGGSPTNIDNLWPEPYAGVAGARTKDLVETKLKALVCVGKVTLRSAQIAIASDWYVAYKIYVLGIDTSAQVSGWDQYRFSRHDFAVSPQWNTQVTSTPTPTYPTGATALCKDGSYSYSVTHSGSCSHHRGVAQFYP